MTNVPEKRLTPVAFADQVFTDHKRQKTITTLFFRLEKPASRAAALDFINDVVDHVSQAGLLITDTIKINMTPDPTKLVTAESLFRVHLSLEVEPQDVQQKESEDWVVSIRAILGKPR